ncbi:MAG: copper chaperone PCu(A)C [Gammaproteobacteria bacterium]|nr:copper chaperone PCu(A)C [Gammaproteobacteria bacterium]
MFRLLIALVFIASASLAQAEMHFEDVWSRATAPGLQTGAVYFTLRNDRAEGDRMVGVETDRAARVELHQTVEEGGNSRMMHTPEVRVPANGTVIFEPGGRHVMLMGLNEALTEGEVFTITLLFERAGPITLEVDVRPATYMGHSH